MAPPPPPKKSMFPLFFFILLTLSTLFILTLHPSCPAPASTLARLHNLFAPSRHPTPRFTLIIKVLTYNRLASLSRCLNSLALAHYDDFTTVHLHILIDHFPLEYNVVSRDLNSKLDTSRKILDFVERFEWNYGEKLVHYRNLNVGLQSQWLEAWWPSSDHEFVFVVEDDLELSPLYFRFIKKLILNYYYNESNFSPMIFGASLQRPKVVLGRHGNKIHVDNQTQLFLYQLVGSWGQLLFPRPWKEFRLWYDMHKAKDIKPILGGMVSTRWYKRKGERIWTPWFIKFVHVRGYFNIYTYFRNETALSVSHRESGVNYRRTAGPDSYLVDRNSYDSILEMLPLSSLKWYDFCFREVIPDRIVKNFDQLGSVLQPIQKLNTVFLINLQSASEMAVRNLLCHFERLAIENYIFVGQKSNLSLDLARRGHPMIDVDQLSFDNNKLYKSMKIKESGKKWMKDIFVHAFVIRKLLELNQNVLVLNSNMVPLSSGLLLDSTKSINDIIVGENLKLLFIKSSSASLKIWTDDFVYKVTAMGDTLASQDSASLVVNFVRSVGKKLEENRIKYGKIDESQISLYIDTTENNQTNLGNGKKFAFWSAELDLEVVQKKLADLDLWALDGDFSCKAVVCHKS